MSKHILSEGDLVLDITLPVSLPVHPAAHQDAPTREVEPGGAANFMIAAHHMGLHVTAAGTVGADSIGDLILAPLDQAGIDTRFVVRVPGSTSTMVIVLTDQKTGQHAFLGQYGTGDAVPYPDTLDTCISQVDAVFIQGYTLSEKRIVPMAHRALRQAVASQIPIYLDVGPFMAHVPPEEIAWVVSQSTVVLTTEDEVPLVSGGRTGQEAYAQLLSQGPQLLVIKQGPQGCTLVTNDWSAQVPGFPVQVVDTVGAGDCFDGAFTAALLSGLDLWQCGRLANAMGAMAVQKVGAGRNAPTCAEVMNLLHQAGERIDFSC